MSQAAQMEKQAIRRFRYRVRGAVQGVGFRPFAYALARQMALKGFVYNDSEGVLIEVEGVDADRFAEALLNQPPPLARIDAIEPLEVETAGDEDFRVLKSHRGKTATRIAADAATCSQCLEELFDPQSRFFGYPFINCTHCGPRYTITRALPYDRAQTSMSGFPMCKDCRADYENPLNRRFHAEPVACPTCGPTLSHNIAEVAEAIRAGKIVALKGIGGFHLICDAFNAGAISEMRRRKARDEKPFAVMVRDLDAARQLARIAPAEEELLASPAHPVVLVENLGHLPEGIAPGLRKVGVMLAYAPVHHLLLADLETGGIIALVATSANPGGEPLVASNADAERRLAGIADLIVTHDRDIVVRADDSVMQIVSGAPAFLRRARGFVPEPVDLGAADGPDVIALGGDLKNTVCVTRGREAFLSQHIGGLDNVETIRFQEETVRHLCAILDVKPDFAACDLHPDFRSVRLAENLGLPLVRVQHHVAHIAAVAAERHLSGPLLGVALDGHGYGADGGVWGGELIRLEGCDWRHLGGLQPLPLPGGDKAAREPWRMAVGALHASGNIALVTELFPEIEGASLLADMIARGMKYPMTSSLGRLFDAAAAIAGLPSVQRHEGQAAMMFEAQVTVPTTLANGFKMGGGKLDFRPLLLHMAVNRLRGAEAANLFHGTLIAGLAEWVATSAASGGLSHIVLGGGCIMNRVLTEGLSDALKDRNLEVFLPRYAPANDGGIALGQAAFARHAAINDPSLFEESETCA